MEVSSYYLYAASYYYIYVSAGDVAPQLRNITIYVHSHICVRILVSMCVLVLLYVSAGDVGRYCCTPRCSGTLLYMCLLL
jgi:hypothetical protein